MIQQLSFRAMGCDMMVALDSESSSAKRHLAQVPVWFETWEAHLSRFRPDSELTLVNQRAGTSQQVSEVFWQVLQLALEVERRSDGLVSPFILDALILAGYDRSFDQMTGRAANPQGANGSTPTGGRLPVTAPHYQAGVTLPPVLLRPSFDGVEMLPETRTLRLPTGWCLDYGGLAKGWAASMAMRKLRLYGPALVDAGGDIACSGMRRDGTPWPVAVADPWDPDESLGLLQVGRAGIATSGKDYRRWQKDNVWQHHIIDPRSGAPAANDVLSVTVIAPTVTEAEMAAKVVLILGKEAGMAWLEAQAGMQGLLVLEDGARQTSSGFYKYLWE